MSMHEIVENNSSLCQIEIQLGEVATSLGMENRP